MAHTFRNLRQQLVSWENLVAAYAKCRRKKRSRPEAAAFDFARESNLFALQRNLLDGTYLSGEYRNFYVFNPKRRKTSAAPFRDRVVHHAVVRILEPLYEWRFMHDSYACRRHKGTHRAIDRAERYLRRHSYYLKTDLVKFFSNVDHGVLLYLLSSRIRDVRFMELIRRIVASGAGVLLDEATQDFFPGDDSCAIARAASTKSWQYRTRLLERMPVRGREARSARIAAAVGTTRRSTPGRRGASSSPR